jgi:hypothetical protein
MPATGKQSAGRGRRHARRPRRLLTGHHRHAAPPKDRGLSGRNLCYMPPSRRGGPTELGSTLLPNCPEAKSWSSFLPGAARPTRSVTSAGSGGTSLSTSCALCLFSAIGRSQRTDREPLARGLLQLAHDIHCRKCERLCGSIAGLPSVRSLPLIVITGMRRRPQLAEVAHRRWFYRYAHVLRSARNMPSGSSDGNFQNSRPSNRRTCDRSAAAESDK